jgi:hypothetical protein
VTGLKTQWVFSIGFRCTQTLHKNGSKVKGEYVRSAIEQSNALARPKQWERRIISISDDAAQETLSIQKQCELSLVQGCQD